MSTTTETETASELLARVRPLVAIVFGALVGGVIYGITRAFLPAQLGFGAAVVGVLAGLGARLGGAIGSRGQLRVVVFGTLFTLVLAEFAIYLSLEFEHPFAVYLTDDAVWLVSTVFFMIGGIFFGVRLLVGGDPLGDVLTHGASAIPPGASGTECPRCDSTQTRLDPTTLALVCAQCGHSWRHDDA